MTGRLEQLAPSRVRIGGFELNLTTGELCSFGEGEDSGKVLLREQPFQILKLLIDRGGKLVTREEIRRRLWPNDTIVNFDHSINVAIGVLRRALSDSAETPRYIETVARRGYRLLIPAEILQTNPVAPPAQGDTQDLSGLAGLVGRKVSHYRVLEVIGGGGMGMVYKAEDLRLGRWVALKFLPPEVADDPITLQRFEREAQTASTLNHPNICTIYEIEEQDGHPFIVMELLEGMSLNHELDASAPRVISIPRLLEIACQVCDGLQAAHEKRIIHRDIKPGNIFLTTQGLAKILDFGLAKLVEHEEAGAIEPAPDTPDRVNAIHASLTLTGTAMGTAGYMSPEQVRKEKLDIRTDLFSFGLVLYEAATGERAFGGLTEAVVHNAILHQDPKPARQVNPQMPRSLEIVIAKALEKDRNHRYQSAAEMRKAIEHVGKETSLAPRRWVAAGLLGFLGVIIMALLGAWIYWRTEHPMTLSRNDTIVLAVANQAKDPIFDDALYLAALFGLQQTPYIHVLET